MYQIENCGSVCMKRPQEEEEKDGNEKGKHGRVYYVNAGYIKEPEKHTLVAIVSKTDKKDSQWPLHLQRGMPYESSYVFPCLRGFKENMSTVSRQGPNEEIRASITNGCGR